MNARSITIASTETEVEALRPVWTELAPANLDSDIDYFLTILRTDPGAGRPHVIHVATEDGRNLLAVARTQDVSVPLKLGYWTLAAPKLRTVLLCFGGLLGVERPSDEILLLDCLQKPLGSGEADMLLLRALDTEGVLFKAASLLGTALRRSGTEPRSNRWTAPLPATIEEFLGTRSAKSRQRLRGTERKFLKDYAGRLRLHRFEHPDEIERLRRDMSSVAACSYQRSLGAGFSDTALEQALLDLTLSKGWHRTWMLYIDEKPVSFWTGTICNEVFSIGTPGFNPLYAKDSVGRFTMMRMLEDLCADPAIKRLDFGQGDAEYKAAFAESVRLETNCHIVSARARPVLVNVAASACGLINNQGRRLVRETDWARRLKRFWRRSIGGRSVSNGGAPALSETGLGA